MTYMGLDNSYDCVILFIYRLRKYKMTDTELQNKLNEILTLIEDTIAQLSEEDAEHFVMDIQENISEMLPN